MVDGTAKWISAMDALKTQVDVVLDAIPRGSRVCYIDYPVHRNVGDLLIMRGTEAFFRANGIETIARYSVNDCPDTLNLPPGTIVAFHGGGNFGDLYPAHQRLRERLTKVHADRRVVVLPQTVFYTESADTSAAVACMGAHPDLHVFARDVESNVRIKKLLPNATVKLSPDMAHYLWPTLYRGHIESGMGTPLRIIRRDQEAVHLESDGKPSMDWDDIYSLLDKGFVRCFRAVQRRRWLSGDILARIWLAYSNHAINKAVQQYKQYHGVETSRLHGHILACLLGIPSVLIDNSYEKNSAYFNLWTHALPGCRLLRSN